VPAALADIMERRERITVLPNDVAGVAGFLRSHARRARPNLGAA
jgi:threonine synthase